jgi:hypothetical protein
LDARRLASDPLPSGRRDTSIELCIPIQDDVTLRASFGKGLTQLLDDPLRRWVTELTAVTLFALNLGITLLLPPRTLLF